MVQFKTSAKFYLIVKFILTVVCIFYCTNKTVVHFYGVFKLHMFHKYDIFLLHYQIINLKFIFRLKYIILPNKQTKLYNDFYFQITSPFNNDDRSNLICWTVSFFRMYVVFAGFYLTTFWLPSYR